MLNAVFAWMDENLQYDKQRVTLAGQSNGGLGAFFVARMQPERFQSIVVLPGAFGAEGSLDMLRGKPIWLLVGERDTQWVELSKRTRDLLMLGGPSPSSPSSRVKGTFSATLPRHSTTGLSFRLRISDHERIG